MAAGLAPIPAGLGSIAVPAGAAGPAEAISAVVSAAAPAGTITTGPGSGVAGFGGDGGPARAARLREPRNVDFDTAGDLYIVDEGNNRVRKVSRDGTISTVAGNGSLPELDALGCRWS